jgi:GT2 family glycosyltransferase
VRKLYDHPVELPPEMPAGAIILATGDQPRYHEFTVSLLHTMARGIPMGTTLKWNRGLNLCPSLNDAVKRALEDGAAWCWFLGDDHTWAPDLLMRLWLHHAPLVAPLVRRRSAPFDTVMSRDGERVVLPDGTRGLLSVDAVGSAGLLVQREVFEALGANPFEIADPYSQHEDVGFCHKARRAGFPIVVDTDLGMGHLATVEVWPARTTDGKHVHSLVSSLTMQLL